MADEGIADSVVDDEVKLTVRMSRQRRQALKLRALRQGRSVQDLLQELITAELAKDAAPAPRLTREEFVAALLARRGIDPTDPEFQAILQRAQASARSAPAKAGRADGAQRGAA